MTVAELSRSLAAWRGRQRARAPGAATTEPRAAARPLGRPGRSRPEPMPQLALTVGPVRVSHQLEMAQDPPQPRRVQPPGRRHQHRLSLNRDLVGQVLGAMSQHPSMSHRELPTNQRLGGRRQRTTNNAEPSGHCSPPCWPPDATGHGASPRSSQPPGLGRPRQRPHHRRPRVVGASGLPADRPAPATPGPARPRRHRSAGPVLRGQFLNGCRQRRQPIRTPGRQPGRRASRMCVRVHRRNLSTRHENTTTIGQPGDNSSRRSGHWAGRSGAARVRTSCWLTHEPQGPTHVPGERMGPDPPCELPAWGPRA